MTTAQTTARKRTTKTASAQEVAQTPRRPRYFVSLLPDGTAVGWDQCGTCTVTVQECSCEAPTAPKYVLGMIAREKADLEAKAAEEKAAAVRTKKAAKDTVPDDTATEVENPDEALEEAAEELEVAPSE